MKTIKGPGIFLAQFIGEAAPFNRLDTIARAFSRFAATAMLAARGRIHMKLVRLVLGPPGTGTFRKSCSACIVDRFRRQARCIVEATKPHGSDYAISRM